MYYPVTFTKCDVKRIGAGERGRHSAGDRRKGILTHHSGCSRNRSRHFAAIFISTYSANISANGNYLLPHKQSVIGKHTPCVSDLTPCMSDVTHCVGDVTPCVSDVTHCVSDLTYCVSDVTPCMSDVTLCVSDVTPCVSDVTLCVSDVTYCVGDLTHGVGDVTYCVSDVTHGVGDVTHGVFYKARRISQNTAYFSKHGRFIRK